MKFARIIIILSKRLHIPQRRALHVFYSTKVYRYMYDLQFHLHNMGDEYCADEVMLKLENA